MYEYGWVGYALIICAVACPICLRASLSVHARSVLGACAVFSHFNRTLNHPKRSDTSDYCLLLCKQFNETK